MVLCSLSHSVKKSHINDYYPNGCQYTYSALKIPTTHTHRERCRERRGDTEKGRGRWEGRERDIERGGERQSHREREKWRERRGGERYRERRGETEP